MGLVEICQGGIMCDHDTLVQEPFAWDVLDHVQLNVLCFGIEVLVRRYVLSAGTLLVQVLYEL